MLTFFSLFAKISGVERALAIEWSTRAIKDMRRLAPRDGTRIISKIEQYAGNPESLANQVTTLTDSRYRRLRAGSHRVIFSIERGEPASMVVLRVRHRREAYD